MLTRLLIPLDGSEVSSAILHYTQALASNPDTLITLLHVSEDGNADGNSDTAGQHPCLASAFQALQELGWQVEALTRSGDPATVILATAKTIAASLILISTHGRSGLDRICEGSVTESVLRHSDCPLLILHSTRPEPGDTRAGNPFKRMLVPLDGTQESAAILSCVEQFARMHDTEIVLFHDAAGSNDESSDGLKAAHIRAMLEQHSVHLANAGLRVRLDWTSYRHPIREILNSIDSLCIDVVAMATHTHSGQGQALEESVTADVIRHARCPLLVWACAHCSDQGMS
jgi:nucleotide-binding universal stress UspA family protein